MVKFENIFHIIQFIIIFEYELWSLFFFKLCKYVNVFIIIF